MAFGRRPSNISKGIGLKLIHEKLEEDPMRNDRVSHVWRGSIKNHKKI